MTELSIVIPVYNSEQILPELAKQLTLSLEGYTFELILVNDRSRDESWNRITSLAEQDHRIVGINLRKNVGQENAIMAGLRYSQGKYVVIMDDDLQHSPSDIVRLHEKCSEGYDICYATFNCKKQAAWKNFGSWLNGKLAEMTLKKPQQIYLSPFQIIRRETVEEVKKYQGPFPYVQGLLLAVTDKVCQIDAEHHPRRVGRSNFTLARSLSVFFRTATGHSILPLRMASFLGVGTAVIGFLLCFYYLGEYFFSAKIVEGWTTLMLVNLIIGGCILTSLGLIGEYVGRILLTVSSAPQYTVENVLDRREPQKASSETGVTWSN